MNDLQKKTIQAIVNIFETGRVAGDYGAVTLLKGDQGHLTYGRSQTTLASGYLFLLVKGYCERDGAQLADRLTPFLPQLSARNFALDTDFAFRELLREAGTDPLMQAEQDRFFDDYFLSPSCRTAQAKGITSALGQAVVSTVTSRADSRESRPRSAFRSETGASPSRIGSSNTSPLGNAGFPA